MLRLYFLGNAMQCCKSDITVQECISSVKGNANKRDDRIEGILTRIYMFRWVAADRKSASSR